MATEKAKRHASWRKQLSSTVLDNRQNYEMEIHKSPKDIQDFLRIELEKLLHPAMEESILSHLDPATQTGRFNLLKDNIQSILKELPN
jgi:hypothetical protein